MAKRKQATDIEVEPTTSEPTQWERRSLEASIRRAEERVTQTRLSSARTIVKATMQLLSEKGGPAFTVKEVAERAEVALMTLYRHFPTKDHLILAVVEEGIRNSARLVREEVQTKRDPMDRLRTVIHYPLVVTMSGEGPPIIQEHMRLFESFPRELELAMEPMRALIAEVLHEAESAGVLGSVDMDRAPSTVLHIILAFAQGIRMGSFETPGVEADYVTDFCIAALTCLSDDPRAKSAPRRSTSTARPRLGRAARS